jgi:hypothetical protein
LLFLQRPDVASHQRTRALIAASAGGSNTGFGGSGLLGPNQRMYGYRLACGWLGLLEDPPKDLI